MHWTYQTFDELTLHELYDILALRQSVFIVEQKSPYLDADGVDRRSLHVCGHDGDCRLVAYLRIVPPGVKYKEPSIGRVVTHASARRKGLGRDAMQKGLARLDAMYPGCAVRISSQQYLEKFYQGFDFATVSEPYDEDGIPHVEMFRGGVCRK